MGEKNLISFNLIYIYINTLTQNCPKIIKNRFKNNENVPAQ